MPKKGQTIDRQLVNRIRAELAGRALTVDQLADRLDLTRDSNEFPHFMNTLADLQESKLPEIVHAQPKEINLGERNQFPMYLVKDENELIENGRLTQDRVLIDLEDFVSDETLIEQRRKI